MSGAALTLQNLVKMKEQFDKDFPPSKFDKGADMCRDTFLALTQALGIKVYTRDGGMTWFDPHKVPIIGVEIHIVPSIPFGEVEPCRCKERQFRKDFIEGMEIVQALTKDEIQCVREFEQSMREETIPNIVETIRKRQAEASKDKGPLA